MNPVVIAGKENIQGVFGVSRRLFRRWVDEGFPAWIEDGIWRVETEAGRAWIQERAKNMQGLRLKKKPPTSSRRPVSV